MIPDQPGAARSPNRDHAEAGRLAEEVIFSAQRGDAREGRRMSIMVHPQADPSGSAMDVLVVYHVFGHRRVDWSGRILAVRKSPSGDRPVAFSFVQPDGSVVFKGLPLATYRLALQTCDRGIWTASEHLPPPEQVGRQGWLEPELVCGALADRAAQANAPKSAGAEAVAVLGVLAGRSAEMAVPALGACLDILCNPSARREVRASASGAITARKTPALAGIDLSLFPDRLCRPPLSERGTPPPEPLELKLYEAFGTVLSARPSLGPAEQEVLEALVARSQTQPVATRGAVAVHTSGAVKTSRRPARRAGETQLLALARSGGGPVCRALVRLLKTIPADDRLLAALRKLIP